MERSENQPPVVWIQGADPRGVLFGVGALLRNLQWGQGEAKLPADLDIATAPVSPIRGHQLGYRARANSWDAWTEQQFDQYIRELALFGTNSIENIPFQDERSNKMMKYSRRDFNKKMSEICDRYGLDYWIWTPADFDLKDETLRAEMLDKHETLYRDCKRLDGVFFPAGDPGDNPPELVLPFLEDLSQRLATIHPDTKIWLSLQRLNRRDVQFIFDYIKEQKPKWLGGLVAGPSSPPIPLIRNSLPAEYKFRLYPDITHNKLCQYIVPWWDPAYAVTLGREAINPRPREYAEIHNLFAPYSDGFISYSDGVHDDLNKVVWSMLGWDPNRDVREIVTQYCNVFFAPKIASAAADGIFALEKNWQGALADNAAVEGTLLYWNQLEKQAPQLSGNWRWQMNLLRANYDAFVRRRLIYETELEQQANAILAQAPKIGAEAAMTKAMEVLNRTKTQPCSPELHARIEAAVPGPLRFDRPPNQRREISGQRSGARGDPRFRRLSAQQPLVVGGSFRPDRQVAERRRTLAGIGDHPHLGKPGPGELLRRSRQHRQVAAPDSLESCSDESGAGSACALCDILVAGQRCESRTTLVVDDDGGKCVGGL